jgi:hypothetical protein
VAAILDTLCTPKQRNSHSGVMDGWVRRETGGRFALEVRRLWGFPDECDPSGRYNTNISAARPDKKSTPSDRPTFPSGPTRAAFGLHPSARSVRHAHQHAPYYIRAIIMIVPLLQILRYLAKSPDTWFARHELANWALARAAHKLTYPQLF